MKNRLLSFVTDSDGNQVFVHMNREGVIAMQEALERLRHHLEADECEHDHLFTEDWGGTELSSMKLYSQEDEVNQVHHVKLYAWNDEWTKKHFEEDRKSNNEANRTS